MNNEAISLAHIISDSNQRQKNLVCKEWLQVLPLCSMLRDIYDKNDISNNTNNNDSDNNNSNNNKNKNNNNHNDNDSKNWLWRILLKAVHRTNGNWNFCIKNWELKGVPLFYKHVNVFSVAGQVIHDPNQ